MKGIQNISLSSHSDVRSKLGLKTHLSDAEKLRFILSRNDSDYSSEPAVYDVLYGLTQERYPKTIVEIGTYKGISAMVFAEALSGSAGARIYTIDDGSQCEQSEARERLEPYVRDGRVVKIEKSSVDAFSAWGRARIDLLFIDGDHSFAGACTDFALWARYVHKDGLIVMHDTYTRMRRRFPEDYVFPLSAFNILNIETVDEWFCGQEWEGCAFITFASS
jgi:predicted O-methyltransferase YrrM